MSGELVPFTGILPALIGEARRRRVTMGVIFAAIALIALGGWKVPEHPRFRFASYFQL